MQKKRQTVFFMTDTTRPDMLGCYGDPLMCTPNLDALADSGVRFDQAYTTMPVCGPARGGIFTGHYPHTTGTWSNGECVSSCYRTLGQRLSSAGVHCAYIGKWHLDGGDYFGNGVCPDGWDPQYWYDMHCYLNELPDDIRLASRKSGTVPSDACDTYAYRCAERAIKFIQAHQDEDFLLVVSMDEPHGPSISPEAYHQMYQDYVRPVAANTMDPLAEKPFHQKIWAGDRLHAQTVESVMPGPEKIRRELACNSFADAQIGRVLAVINALAPDSLVLYTSDHGEMGGAHRLMGKGPAAYEEITHIPLIIRNGSSAVGVYAHPVSHIDLVPTILDFYEQPMPESLSGKSLMPAVNGSAERINDYVFMEYGRYETDHDAYGAFQPYRAVYDGRYKLVVNLLCEDELYDLEKDPYEMDNLILQPDKAAIRNGLHDVLLDWMNDTRDPFRGFWWKNRYWRTDADVPTWAGDGYTRQPENDQDMPRQYDYATGSVMEHAVRKIF